MFKDLIDKVNDNQEAITITTKNGTLLAIIGGFLMGGSSYFLPKPKK